ncbi:MAG TPA: DUF2099 family protein [Methanocorpusculum sp.]|nr:DUF2099 family protein [Methanocorpusculum sp.]
MMKDRHVVEAIGMTRIVIEDGKIVDAGEPKIRFCPFAKRFAVPVNPVTSENVAKNIEGRINSFGMCRRDREVEGTESMVLFGASELLMTALEKKLIDAAVICCDGAGTVVVPSPKLVQGIGGKMSGLVKTVPYPEVISRIEEAGGFVADKEFAALDPVRGILCARAHGFAKIAVTVAGTDHELAESIRAQYPDALIIAVHTSGVTSLENARRLMKVCDLVFACASVFVREAATECALVQGGVGVPVFAVSMAGKRIVLERLLETNEPFLVKNMRLPVTDMGRQPEPLI